MPEPGLQRELIAHLRNIESTLSPVRAVAEATRRFMADGSDAVPADAERGSPVSGPVGSPVGSPVARVGHGYQWKTLFLPDTTSLRMVCGNRLWYASVVGDAIMFEGRAVTPRGLTVAIAGEGRNAWRDLWLKLPGERAWKPASRCRRECEARLSAPPSSPADLGEAAAALSEAAASVAKALEAALALVAGMTPLPGADERRKGRLRRTSDAVLEDCAFDDQVR